MAISEYLYFKHMAFSKTESLYELLRMAVGAEDSVFNGGQKLSDEQWETLHVEALKQLLAGVVYGVVAKLPQAMRPSLELVFQWASEAETIKGHNVLLNKEAARLTQLFKEQGLKSAVLKGPANARLYPNPYARQAGDIDIWVEGGKKALMELLPKVGLESDEIVRGPEHHINLKKDRGIGVEVHFRPSSGNFNPFTHRRLLSFLEKEIQKTESTPDGFDVPTLRFALAMQLAHIQHHFLGGGVGLKQLLDYYILLQHSTPADREFISENLGKFGLRDFAGSLMWILGHVFKLERAKMLCEPNEKYGPKILADCVAGGNFGYHKKKLVGNFVQHWIRKKKRELSFFGVAPVEMFWLEVMYWKGYVKSIPLRIRLRRVSIRDLYE